MAAATTTTTSLAARAMDDAAPAAAECEQGQVQGGGVDEDVEVEEDVALSAEERAEMFRTRLRRTLRGLKLLEGDDAEHDVGDNDDEDDDEDDESGEDDALPQVHTVLHRRPNSATYIVPPLTRLNSQNRLEREDGGDEEDAVATREATRDEASKSDLDLGSDSDSMVSLEDAQQGCAGLNDLGDEDDGVAVRDVVAQLDEAAHEDYAAMTGYLEKKTAKAQFPFRHPWQRKWFYLCEHQLYYFNEGSTRPRACLDLRLVELARKDGSERFTLTLGPRTFQLRAESPERAAAWAESIEKNARLAHDLAADLPPPPGTSYPNDMANASADDLPQKAKFWRVASECTDLSSLESTGVVPPTRIMIADYAANECKTGDIILFRTKGFKGRMIRAAGGGDYDHVGLLLHYEDGQLGVLETLSNTGVQVTNFEGFCREGWYSQYSRMVVRKLHADVDDERTEQIAEFVKAVVGKKYRWTPKKAMRTQSMHDFLSDKRTFFCSELVAALYIHIGLLRESMAGTAYMPGSFGERHHLLLMDGAWLGPEQLLVFDAPDT